MPATIQTIHPKQAATPAATCDLKNYIQNYIRNIQQSGKWSERARWDRASSLGANKLIGSELIGSKLVGSERARWERASSLGASELVGSERARWERASSLGASELVGSERAHWERASSLGASELIGSELILKFLLRCKTDMFLVLSFHQLQVQMVLLMTGILGGCLDESL